MIGESIMNEYKAYKNLVKHKKRINRVFSEICAENSFRSRRLGVDKKAPAVVWLAVQLHPLNLFEEDLRKKGRTTQMTLLLLGFVLTR
jgi:DNA-directed RNA polymerase subunit N (RpoN/RPB10)